MNISTDNNDQLNEERFVFTFYAGGVQRMTSNGCYYFVILHISPVARKGHESNISSILNVHCQHKSRIDSRNRPQSRFFVFVIYGTASTRHKSNRKNRCHILLVKCALRNCLSVQCLHSVRLH